MKPVFPKLPAFKDTWPLLFLVVAVAMHPVPGTLLVVLGMVSVRNTRAPGLWPWDAAFWPRMRVALAGSVAIVVVGTLLHLLLVRPIFDATRVALGS